MRRMTNSIRRCDTTSLLSQGEVWNLPGTLAMACKAIPGCIAWLEAQRWEDVVRKAGRPVSRGDGWQESEPS